MCGLASGSRPSFRGATTNPHTYTTTQKAAESMQIDWPLEQRSGISKPESIKKLGENILKAYQNGKQTYTFTIKESGKPEPDITITLKFIKNLSKIESWGHKRK